MERKVTTAPIKDGEVSGGMTYYKNLNLAYDLTLPLRESPIRFGILRRNGLSSNAWRCWSEKQGDIYIACRDHMADLKISLHQSGRHHIAFTTESGREMKEGSRFWDVWAEPQDYNGSKVVPTFNLYFPSWGLGLTKADRDGNPKVWNKNQLFVEAAESPQSTVVSFVIADANAAMQFSTSGELPSFPLGVLPARAGKVIWIIANQVPEGNMRKLAGQGLGGINEKMAEKLRGFPSGYTLGMCVTGITTDGSAFMMPFPVQMHWKGISEATIGSKQT